MIRDILQETLYQMEKINASPSLENRNYLQKKLDNFFYNPKRIISQVEKVFQKKSYYLTPQEYENLEYGVKLNILTYLSST